MTSDGSPPVDIDFLLGEWEGEGEGLWGGFSFKDRLSFAHRGKAWIEYHQLTRTLEGATSHAESGYLSLGEDGTVSMTIAAPTGITEVLTGSLTTEGIVLGSTEIGQAPTALNVTATARRLILRDETLLVELDIAMNDEALTGHTRSILKRA